MKIKSLFSLLLIAVTSFFSAAQSTGGSTPTFRLYDLEYKIIPVISNSSVPGELNEESLLDLKPVINTLVENYALALEFDPNDIKVQPFVRGDVRGIVYTFPDPYKIPLAKFGAIVFTSVTENRYFTLEASINFGEEESECWILGETSAPGTHRNFGIVPDCESPEAFIDVLEKMNKLQPSETDPEKKH
ncbi:MAG: hypothetical protein K2H98_07760 [Duncaniella sp.]|nr:hypothetical protein [Duncaniella sp.]